MTFRIQSGICISRHEQLVFYPPGSHLGGSSVSRPYLGQLVACASDEEVHHGPANERKVGGDEGDMHGAIELVDVIHATLGAGGGCRGGSGL